MNKRAPDNRCLSTRGKSTQRNHFIMGNLLSANRGPNRNHSPGFYHTLGLHFRKSSFYLQSYFLLCLFVLTRIAFLNNLKNLFSVFCWFENYFKVELSHRFWSNISNVISFKNTVTKVYVWVLFSCTFSLLKKIILKGFLRTHY